MTSTVTIAGTITAYGSNQRADGVYQLGARFFEDWYSTADSKAEIRERPVADGAFGIDRDWRASLPLQMSGRFRGPTWLTMMNTLRTALSTGVGVTVAVTDDLGTTSRVMSVRRFVPHPNPGAQMCTFDCDMVAVDPNRYGPAQAPFTGLPTPGTGTAWPAVWPADWGTGGDPGRVSATNLGSATTYPVLEIIGGLSAGAELVELSTGSVIRLDREIPATSTAFINLRTGRAYLDMPANDIGGFLTRRDWWSMPPGVARTVQFNPLGITSGTPRLTVRFSPAY